ncbi:MAG: endonuclease domain-containing protein [Sphingomicrobium sp.]
MSATDIAYKNARRLRRELSLPEKLLWIRLRGAEVRFRRQHPIGSYVLDFYCAAAKLAIEVDGAAHDHGDRPHRDDIRVDWLKRHGIEVLRIPAKEYWLTPTPSPTHLPGSVQDPSTAPHELRSQGGAEE